MKTILTQPTALKGLLLLALIANLSHGSQTFKANQRSVTQTTTLSSEADREPAQAATAAASTTTPPAVDLSTPAVGVATSAPVHVLTKAEKAAEIAKRKALRASGRAPSDPTQKDDLVTSLQSTSTPPTPPTGSAAPAAPAPAPAPLKTAVKAPATTASPDAPAADTKPVKAAAVADTPTTAKADDSAPADAKPFPKTTEASAKPFPKTAAAKKPVTKKPVDKKTAAKKPKRTLKVVTAETEEPSQSEQTSKPAPTSKPDETKLAAEVCTTGECQRQQGIDKVAHKLAEFYANLSDAQAKNWINCSKGDKAACDAYASSKDQKPDAEAVAPFPATGAAPPQDVPQEAAAPELTDLQKLKTMTDEFTKDARSLHSSTDQATKERLEARMSELYDSLNEVMHNMYVDKGNRPAVDDSITRMTTAMMGSAVSSNFQMHSKINSLRSIKSGFALKDLSDKTTERMDATSDQVREDQNRLDMAQQQYKMSLQYGQPDTGSYFEMQQAQRDLIMKRQELVTIDQEFTRSASQSMIALQMYRSDISATDYATYTSSYQQVQADFQTLINPQSAATAAQSFGPQGQQQPTMFTGANGATGFGQQNQFGMPSAAPAGFGQPTQFGAPTGFGNTSAQFGGVQPIQAIPFTGVTPGINSGLTAMPFAPTSGVNGFNTGATAQYGVAPFANTSAFGGCQTSPVYNGYMPTQPTCLASGNYALSNQSQFGNGLQPAPFRSPMTSGQYRSF